MRRNLEWFDGAPEKLEPGMVLLWRNGKADIVGGVDCEFSESSQTDRRVAYFLRDVSRWAWLVTPAELEWLEAMATSNAKSRPEQ